MAVTKPLTPTAVKRPRGRPKKSIEDRDEGNRRQAIIASAAQLFKLKGYDATSTREIAKRVGMTSGSPFYHFVNKQELLLAVMVEGMKQAIHRQHAACAQDSPQATDRARLRTLIRHHLDVLLGADSDFIPVMLYEWHALDSEQRKKVTALKDAYESAWVPLLQSLYDKGQLQAPVKLARLMILGALNWTVQWYETPAQRLGDSVGDAATLDDLTTAAMQLFVK